MNKFVMFSLVLMFQTVDSYAAHEAFDHCGLDNYPTGMNPFYEMKIECPEGTNDWRRFDAVRQFGVPESNAMARVATGDDRFYTVAVEAEFAWVRGNDVRMRRCLSLLGNMLRMEDEYRDVLGTYDLRRCRNRICYMLARMVNYRGGDRPRILFEDIDSALPRMETTADLKRIFLRQETFRRMLKVGVALEECLKKKGRLPQRLDEVALLPGECYKDAFGNDIEYVQQGTSWKLYARCDSGSDDFQSVKAIVPSVETSGGLLRGLWFSSSYSADRCSLYNSKVLRIDGESLEVKWSGGGDHVSVGDVRNLEL